MKPIIIFIHIPRTGGTSFIDCLQRNLKCLRFPRGIDPKEGYESYECIHGHFNMHHPEIDRCFPGRERIYFTFLRDPVERVLSNYYFSKHEITLDQWINDNPNMITKYLGDAEGNPNESHLKNALMNLDTLVTYEEDSAILITLFDEWPLHVGLTKYFNQSLYYFKHIHPEIFNTMKYEKKNVTQENRKIQPTRFQLERIKSINSLDLRLYKDKFVDTIYQFNKFLSPQIQNKA